MKRVNIGIAALLFPVLLTACTEPAPENVESVETSTEDSTLASTEDSVEAKEPDWASAYADYIRSEFDTDYFRDDEEPFSLIYVDDNDGPELLIDTGFEAGGEYILTYYDGKVVEQHFSRRGSKYIEHGGLIYTDTGHQDYYPVEITELKDGRFTIIGSGVRYVSEDDWKKMTTDENYPYILTYEWEEQPVTEEEFNAHIAELVDESKLQVAAEYHTYADMLEILDNWGQ